MHNVLIVIVNYYDYPTTEKCIINLNRIGVSADIIVVDNKSPNNSLEVLKKYESTNITVIQSDKNGGYSYGNNYGIQYALNRRTYDYICIMNPDVIIESDLFDDLCLKLDSEQNYAGISALMFLDGKFETDRISWNLIDSNSLYKDYNLLRFSKAQKKIVFELEKNGLLRADVLPGSFFIMKTSVFEKIGWFDENIFLYHEENIIGLKLKKLGYKLVIDTAHYYLHNHITLSRQQVWLNYRNEFHKILRNYSYEYSSRKYICNNFFHGKNLLKLKFVDYFNHILLHLKHLLSFFMK